MLCGILAGWLGLTWDELENSDASYVYHRWLGHCLKMQAHERQMFEVARFQSMFVYNQFAKKPAKKAKDVCTFPWEQAKKKTLTPEKSEQLKKYAK